jgi:hypothetical protein
LQQTEIATINWKWYYAAPEFAVWLVLIAALVLPKANRNIDALAILLPIGILSLLWAIFVKIISMPSSIQTSAAFQSMLIGIALLWLMGDYIGKFTGVIRFLLSVVIMVGTAIICYLSYSPVSLEDVIEFLIVFVCIVFTLLIAITLSRLPCKKTFSQKRFMRWMAFWTLFVCPMTAVFFIFVGSCIFASWPSNFVSALMEIALAGLILGLFVYAINVPFMILGFLNPFFRKRFYACLGFNTPEITDVSREIASDKQKIEGEHSF